MCREATYHILYCFSLIFTIIFQKIDILTAMPPVYSQVITYYFSPWYLLP